MAENLGEDAKFMSGGHSLLPMMKLRFATPEHIIDISKIEGLSFIKEEGDLLKIGGLTTHMAQRMVRRLQGLNLIGADLVEVSPPFDPSGMTAWVGVNLIFELLCVLADAVNRRTV